MRISERVTWPVGWPKERGRVRRFVTALTHSDLTPVDFVNPGHDGRTASTPPLGTDDALLPDDPDAEIPLDHLIAEGPDGVLRDVRLTQRAASIEGLPDIDLLRATLVQAHGPGGTEARHASAPWEFRVEGSGTAVTLYGPWAAFAWLGYLASWPCPPVPAS